MSEVTLDSNDTTQGNDLAAQASPEGELENVSDADAQAFLEYLAGQEEEVTEAILQSQFEKSFQTMSYLFMKGIYSHVEDRVRHQQ